MALLRELGVFAAAVPRSRGGAEMTSAEQTRLIETIATADASIGWCVMIGMDSGIYSGFLTEAAAGALYPRPDLITAGWIHPQGRAERVPGGYRISGDWRFGSGITHCDVLAAGCVVHRDGEPEPDPLTGDPVQWRVALAGPSAYDVHDTWFTTGLAGSGSRDYSVRDLFVPEEHVFSFHAPHRAGPLHAAPDAILRKMSGVPLGLARAALDHVRGLAPGRRDRETGAPWAEDPRVQATLAEAEMRLSAARAAVYTSLDEQWTRLSLGEDAGTDARVATALARYHAFRTARWIVSALYDLVGGSSVYRRSPLDRWLRDVNTMCQHAVAQDSVLRTTGEVLLGGTSRSPFF
ncbi:acyl-CoA dehydrogenase [Actinorhabdospora filicis]|uniref:Acyl-CoA dehydrogenase n=1 Tax=Actinorhabdospora filicis TaxID=1785913 RepID=A0A9W6SKA9_9ACTN|nr:acyl-CoA dehydrogenase [Actinorhabdospora filicis]